MKSAIAFAAALVTAASLGTALPASAEESTAPTGPAVTAAAPAQMPHGQQRFNPQGMNRSPGFGRNFGAGRLLALACSDRGAEALEIALVRLHYRLDLNADQQKLFDTFRAKALTAQTSFADSCKTARPDTTNGRPDLLDRLKSGLAVDQARLAALNTVLPDFEAFYNSLSDQQKADLLPRRFGPGNDRFHRWGDNDRGPARPFSGQS